MPRPEKVQQVEEIKHLVEGAHAVVLTDFTGLNVQELSELRHTLKRRGDALKVVKNTLARLAFQEKGLGDLNPYLVGPNAVVVARKDAVETLKTLFGFSKEVGKGAIKVGIVDGQLYETKDLERISKLPSLQDSRAQVVGILMAPLSGLVYTLQGLLNTLVAVLEEIEKKRKEEG